MEKYIYESHYKYLISEEEKLLSEIQQVIKNNSNNAIEYYKAIDDAAEVQKEINKLLTKIEELNRE